MHIAYFGRIRTLIPATSGPEFDTTEAFKAKFLKDDPLISRVSKFGTREKAKSVFCKSFLEKVASNFSIVLQLHFPQCCKFLYMLI